MIMLGALWLVELASAGTLFYVDSHVSHVQAMDTRTFAVTDFAPLAGLSSPVLGLAFDEDETFWMHFQEPGWVGWASSETPYTSTFD